MGSKTFLESTHVVRQILYSTVPSKFTFDFDLFFGSFLSFWGPNELLDGSGWGSETILGYTHVVEQLFSIVPSILTLDFDLILGLFLAFGGPPNGLF